MRYLARNGYGLRVGLDKVVTLMLRIKVMMKASKQRYDSKHKVTRVFLNDYLALKRMSQIAGVSMAEALHRLIEHQAQLPLLDRIARPTPVAQVASTLAPVFRVGVHRPMSVVTPKTAIATNGSKSAAFRIKPKGARYA